MKLSPSRILPPLAVIALVIAAWWGIVVYTESPIFPTPWQVVTGTLELAQDGTLWEHITASLFRVGIGARKTGDPFTVLLAAGTKPPSVAKARRYEHQS